MTTISRCFGGVVAVGGCATDMVVFSPDRGQRASRAFRHALRSEIVRKRAHLGGEARPPELIRGRAVDLATKWPGARRPPAPGGRGQATREVGRRQVAPV